MSFLGGKEFQPTEYPPFDHKGYLKRFVVTCLARAQRLELHEPLNQKSLIWTSRMLRQAVIEADQLGIAIPPNQRRLAFYVIRRNLDFPSE